ncbi:MAG: flagellar biosynthesis protein FliP [Clostridiales bacterium]|jgi:flagellar biosynthetic protein FliP|nr:flagellar biosynthesis protein FliP [Clostridiales bacterium]MDN5281361.1 flagellar biosynthesis protein FliP [Candidatus Ozemobacter sp.]
MHQTFLKRNSNLIFSLVLLCVLFVFSGTASAQPQDLSLPQARVDLEDSTKVDRMERQDTPFPIPAIRIQVDPSRERSQLGTGLQILILLTILSLAPSILIMLTSFTRILIVLSFVRRALGTQQEPSNQIIIGLALFITFFTMSPVIDQIYQNSVKPYIDRDINYVEAYNRGINPIRDFMFKHTRKTDLALFAGMEGGAKPETKDDFSTVALIPAFITSELRTAFQMGVIIYLPFLVIDMVVASLLMSMGMIMLPPVMISLPFKILLFVLVDGWNLVVRSLVVSFGGNA